jgi:hypothetical protein
VGRVLGSGLELEGERPHGMRHFYRIFLDGGAGIRLLNRTVCNAYGCGIRRSTTGAGFFYGARPVPSYKGSP